MTGSEPTPGSVLKSSITEASRKIESIIDDAERAASEIRAHAAADAERQSEVVLEANATRLAAIVDPLVERVERLRTEVLALSHEFESATKDLKSLGGVLSPGANAPVPESTPGLGQAPDVQGSSSAEPASEKPRASTPAPAPPAPVAYPGKSAAPPPVPLPEEVVLRATQMAVSGSSRAEMISALETEFALPDAAAVVDDILGA